MNKQKIFHMVFCCIGGAMMGIATANLKSMLGIFLLVAGIYLVLSSILRMR